MSDSKWLRAELRQYEAKFGMTSAEFWTKWQGPEGRELDCSSDGHEYCSWAMSYELALKTGVL